MKKLRQQDEAYRWDVTGIMFAIPERVGDPRDFIGQVEEIEYLYDWVAKIQRGLSKSTAPFADIVRQEYLAVGIRVALHP
jgi:hypothetical protein